MAVCSRAGRDGGIQSNRSRTGGAGSRRGRGSAIMIEVCPFCKNGYIIAYRSRQYIRIRKGLGGGGRGISRNSYIT